MSIKDNIEARCRAEHVIDLIGEECPRFWEELVRLSTEKLPPKPVAVDPLGPMDEKEAIRFERHTLEFGKHAGEEIGCVPASYLGWLAENDFAFKLRRYLKSSRFQRRQDEEQP